MAITGGVAFKPSQKLLFLLLACFYLIPICFAKDVQVNGLTQSVEDTSTETSEAESNCERFSPKAEYYAFRASDVDNKQKQVDENTAERYRQTVQMCYQSKRMQDIDQDVTTLVEEVERLREELTALRQLVENSPVWAQPGYPAIIEVRPSD